MEEESVYFMCIALDMLINILVCQKNRIAYADYDFDIVHCTPTLVSVG